MGMRHVKPNICTTVIVGAVICGTAFWLPPLVNRCTVPYDVSAADTPLNFTRARSNPSDERTSGHPAMINTIHSRATVPETPHKIHSLHVHQRSSPLLPSQLYMY